MILGFDAAFVPPIQAGTKIHTIRTILQTPQTMASLYDITWFKAVIAPRLLGFTITYRYFEQGELGSLHQVEFNSAQKGGVFDFWGMDWLGVHLVNYIEEVELVNKLLTNAEEHEKERVVDTFLALL